MNFVRYDIPAVSFPRNRYTRKVEKDLAKRYNDLKDKISCDDAPQVRNLSDAEIEDVSIFLSHSLLKEEHFSSIESFCISNAKEQKYFLTERCFETFSKGQLVNSNSFVVTSSVPSIDLQKQFTGHIILVAEKEAYEKAFIHTFNERKNIHVCLVENVREVITTHLERCALTGLKGACEFLEDLINPDGSNYRHAEISKRRDKNITKEKLYNTTTQDYVRRGNTKTTRSQSLQEKFNPCPKIHLKRSLSTTDATRSILDRATGKNKIILVQLCNENKDIKETIERLIDEIVGTFNRSLLPKNEHPELKISMQKSINEKLLQDLRKLSPLIKSCGYRFSTFQVYVDGDTVSDKLTNEIEKILEMHKIASYSVVPSGITLFTKISAGYKISVKAVTKDKTVDVNGTLGGFARTSSGGLWALMSRHVAKLSFDGNVYIKDDKVAKVMKQIKEDETEKQYLDIAAACVEKDVEKSCDTKYITEEGVEVHGRLVEYDAKKLQGLPVHIRGASTPIGLGTITVRKREAVQDNSSDENYIVVEDRDTDKKVKFCTNGDSGAIVCAESQDKFGEEVHLISMVVGKNLEKEGSYTTLRLDKGLTELDRLTEKEFKLC